MKEKAAQYKRYITDQSGQLFILAVGILMIVLVTTVVLVSSAFTYSASSRYSVDTIQATQLAEAGIDKAVAALNTSAGSYNGDVETQLGSGSYDIKVTSIDANNKLIEATGYIPNKAESKAKRKIKIQISKGDGLSFGYGLLAGEGGFQMDGGSQVNGSVFSNADINISGGARITGDVYVAGGTQPTANQQTECTSPNCADYEFGKTISGQSRLDIAQSFKPTTTQVVNKVALKLKKVGNPSNVTVRILADNAGKPNKNTVLASGTLQSNLVTTSYGFAEVGFSTNPTLTAETTYWIMIDTSADNSNYWAWSQDTLSSYTRGTAYYSTNWQAGSPVWSSINGDLGFKVFMGGVITKIAGVGSSYVNGNAYANTMTADNSSALQIGQHAYYQNQSQITAHGTNCNGNNSYCHPGSTDPQPQPMPISQANIDEWKGIADDSVYNGNLTIGWPCTTNLEKKKYVGNVTVSGGCTIQMDTPVWITGNLTISGGSTVRLKPSLGITSGVVVVDGQISLDGGSRFLGSGTTGSYLMGLSTYSHPTNAAITVSGGNSSSIIYAANGIVEINGGTNIREATGKKIRLTGGAIVTYESGVAQPFFTSGPQGSFSVVKGSYQAE